MLNKIAQLLATFFLSTLLISCNGGEVPEKTAQFPSIKDVPASKWEKLAQKKIYFGHQSVGFNIMDGVKDLMRESPQIKLNIVETANKSDFKGGLFAHSRVGKNVDPKSKMDAFARFMENGIGEKADIAFFKFCFVDVLPNTDVDRLFEDYRSAMAMLQARFPNTTFIHTTVPLTSNESGIKAWIKKLKDIIKKIIGKLNFFDNSRRNQFNEMLRKEYEGREPIFDLAKIESTSVDGKRSSSFKNGSINYSLVSDYTFDGGHLNETGRKVVAEQLLVLLARLSD